MAHLEYGHLDRTSDHPAQGVRAPSTPRPVALRSNRSDLRALVHEQNSDLLHPISFKVGNLPAEDRASRTLPAHSTTVSMNLSAWGSKPLGTLTVTSVHVLEALSFWTFSDYSCSKINPEQKCSRHVEIGYM
jgi:hypothetical protein